MFGKIKNFVQLTSIIFTILILMEVVGGIKTDNQIVLAMLTCSLAASLLKLCFFPEVLFEYSPLRQTVYLLLVLFIAIVCNYIWGQIMTIDKILSTASLVVLVYLIIRLVNYQFVRKEAQKMNEYLKKTEKDNHKEGQDHF